MTGNKYFIVTRNESRTYFGQDPLEAKLKFDETRREGAKSRLVEITDNPENISVVLNMNYVPGDASLLKATTHCESFQLNLAEAGDFARILSYIKAIARGG